MNHSQIMGLRRSSGFTSSDNHFFPPEKKLEGLSHQHKLDLRAAVQSDEKYGTRISLTTTEIADLLARQGDSIAKINSYYKQAITKERKKSNVPA